MIIHARHIARTHVLTTILGLLTTNGLRSSRFAYLRSLSLFRNMGGNDDGGIDPATGGLAFGLTCAAGMCTTIGAAVVFNEKVMTMFTLRFLRFYCESSCGFWAGGPLGASARVTAPVGERDEMVGV